mgnify:CR=1 FL=1
MSIEYIHVLEDSLKDIIKLTKRECITNNTISYTGVIHYFETKEQIVKVYSLIPTMEDAQIIDLKTSNGKQLFLIKDNLVATMPLNLTNSFLSRIEAGEQPELPEEIKGNYSTLKKLTSNIEMKSKLDSLFKEYAHLISKLHKMQTNFIEHTERQSLKRI